MFTVEKQDEGSWIFLKDGQFFGCWSAPDGDDPQNETTIQTILLALKGQKHE